MAAMIGAAVAAVVLTGATVVAALVGVAVAATVAPVVGAAVVAAGVGLVVAAAAVVPVEYHTKRFDGRMSVADMKCPSKTRKPQTCKEVCLVFTWLRTKLGCHYYG